MELKTEQIKKSSYSESIKRIDLAKEKSKITRQQNKIYKKIVIDNNLMDLHKNLKFNEMALSGYDVPFYCGVVFNDKNDILKIRSNYNLDVWRCAEQLLHNRQRNKKRLKAKIQRLLDSGPCLFITLTLNDNTYNNITYEKFRQLVWRWLTSLKCNYVANVDFGELNGRMHEHAIIQLDELTQEQCDKWRKYGNINFKRINNNNSSAMAEYLQKFVNHALKDTTKQYRIMSNKKWFY